MLLVAATAISTWQAIRAVKAERLALQQRDIATQARDAEAVARKEVEAEQGKTRDALRGSLLQQSRALRESNKAGQRAKAVAAITEAASIQPGLDLRNEYLRCLDVPDLSVAGEIPYPNKDEAFSKATRDRLQNMADPKDQADYRRSVWSASAAFVRGYDDRIFLMPRQGRPIELDFQSGQVMHLHFDVAEVKHPVAISTDTGLLAAAKLDGAGSSIWNLRKGEHMGDLIGPGDHPVIPDIFAFEDQSRRIAVLSEKNMSGQSQILIFDVDSLQLTKILDVGEGRQRPFIDCLRFHPDGTILAVSTIDAGVHDVSLWNVDEGQRMARLPMGRFLGAYAAVRRPQRIDFSRDGKTLVAGGQAGSIRAWDLSELIVPVEPETKPVSSASKVKEVFHNSLYSGSVSIVRLSPDGRCVFTIPTAARKAIASRSLA